MYPAAGESGDRRVPTRVTRRSFTIVSPRCCCWLLPAALHREPTGQRFANGRVMNVFLFYLFSLLFFCNFSLSLSLSPSPFFSSLSFEIDRLLACIHPSYTLISPLLEIYCARYDDSTVNRRGETRRSDSRIFSNRVEWSWHMALLERRIESVSLRTGRCGFVKRDSLGRCFVRVYIYREREVLCRGRDC